MNDLLACYNAYERLLNTQYRFVVARKGKEYRILITFQWEHFFHLTGIHHLKDLSLSPRSKARAVFRSKIKAGEITMQDILKSKFCVTKNTDIPCRVKYLSYLDQFIASENTILEYLNKSDKGSQIRADWMIKGEFNTQECYLFIEAYDSQHKAIKQKSEYYCKTFFPFQGLTYGSYAMPTIILLKERLNLAENTTETLYCHPTFSEEF